MNQNYTILFLALIVAGCASSGQKYVENIKLQPTSMVCEDFKAIQETIHLDESKSEEEQLAQIQKFSGIESKEYPDFVGVKQYFCKHYKFFFVTTQNPPGSPCKDLVCTPRIWLTNSPRLDVERQKSFNP